MTKGWGIIAVFLLGLSMASAAPLACEPGTLADYISLGSEGCLLNNAVVADFFDVGPIGGFATGIAPEDVLVDPLLTIGGMKFGLQFTYGASAGTGELLESRFTYTFQTAVAGPIVALLGMTGSTVAPDGVNTVVEDFCLGDQFFIDFCGTSMDTAIVFDIGSDSELSALLDLGTFARVGIMNDVVIDGGLAGSASLQAVTNEFVLVPEPWNGPTFALGLIALAGLGMHRRRAGGTR